MIDFELIKSQARAVVEELLKISAIKEGDILVVGCSSSEIVGGNIGKSSSIEAAEVVFQSIYSELQKQGVFLAAQCCEHLNRALIMERACAEKYGYEIVSVVPWAHAGGAFATTAYAGFEDPVAVESVSAHAGIDIGDTLIGMHLKFVAVPVRLTQNYIGSANVVAARTRPKYIGGERAHYNI